ncbi:hypothetical protein JG687_00013925 [Phytophthora cactorum]|uniref:Uncharacterized protein n=1 Tax=Phytophthora cactorum TaxID=29920 RepID=A0A8T1GG07_9STRA|nr:hypothetical protein PC111_g9517 [Phytophthora cactorum]KAG2835154.1 hypothetical protein PC112_g5810 [Phytophthora cactorum]KAG2924077.1 hypothetical protein PC115_g8742 [Phytophthora cactorum]KAG2993152.1 hypothetical protein PC118_g4154 [Phytophthora cactorum]KAG3170513.1 hypothetical protein C6341_g10782 [Phytophthora cactorum]
MDSSIQDLWFWQDLECTRHSSPANKRANPHGQQCSSLDKSSAAESPGTVAPFTQTQVNQAPALDTATNTPNSYSFHNAGQATRTSASGHEQMQTSMVAPALSL